MRRRGTVALAAAAAVVALVATIAATVLVGVAVLVAAGSPEGRGCARDGGPGGSDPAGPRTFTAEQTANARTIVAAAVEQALPERAAVIAVAAAIVESGLRNVSYGDRDSLGLFQQRPSQGWGTPEQLLNPAYAATAFYRKLLEIPRWAEQPPGVAAQAVQRSAFPDRYAPQEPAAAGLVDQLWPGPESPPSGSDRAPVSAGRDATRAPATTPCPEQDESDIPLPPGGLDARALPEGFALPVDPIQRAAVSYALAQLGKPYTYGAKGPKAFDCSGLTTAAWAAAGITIPHGTTNQKLAGTPVPLTQIEPGDLVFTPGTLGSPSNPRHVGIYAGHNLVINAHSTRTGVILQPLTDIAPRTVAIRRINE